MISWSLRRWRTAGAAAVVALAACGEAGQGGESGGPAGGGEGGGEQGEAPVAPPAVAGGGGEQGEAGAASAFAGLSGEQLTALRLQHLRGFVLAAQTVAAAGRADEAGIIVQQGLLEAYDPAAAEFGALDVGPVRAAGEAATPAHLAAALASLDAAQRGLQADPAVLAARMVDLASGLYQNVNQGDVVDPVEYAHSHGAALSARAALAAGAADLRRRNGQAFREASAELDRFAGLWPAADPPEHPASYRDVLAQASRVRLALSPYL